MPSQYWSETGERKRATEDCSTHPYAADARPDMIGAEAATEFDRLGDMAYGMRAINERLQRMLTRCGGPFPVEPDDTAKVPCPGHVHTMRDMGNKLGQMEALIAELERFI